MYAMVREENLRELKELGAFEFLDVESCLISEPAVHGGKPRVVVVMTQEGMTEEAVSYFQSLRLPILSAIKSHNSSDMDCLGLALNGVTDWQNTTDHGYKAGRPVVRYDPFTCTPHAGDLAHLKEFQEALCILLYEEFGLVDRKTFPL